MWSDLSPDWTFCMYSGRVKGTAALIRQVAEAPDYMTGQIITLDGGWI